jgi:hypothetical protein
MTSQEQLDKLRGAAVRIISSSKEATGAVGTIRVVNHEIPIRGQSLNLEINVSPGQPVVLQLTGSEAKQLIATPENREREFRWNGKRRPLRPVQREDLVIAAPEPATVF